MLIFKNLSNLNINNQLLQFLAEKLNITTGEVVIYTNDKLLKSLSKGDTSFEAMLFPSPIDKTYQLIFCDNPSASLEEIICHEFIHLSQFINEKLKYDVNANKYSWLNKEFDNSIPYKERPWEKEAFKLQTKLLKDWKKYKKDIKKLEKLEKKSQKFGK